MSTVNAEAFHNVTVVGAGVIGMSWTEGMTSRWAAP